MGNQIKAGQLKTIHSGQMAVWRALFIASFRLMYGRMI